MRHDGTLWIAGFVLVGEHVFGQGKASEQRLAVEREAEAFVARFASDGSFQCLWHPSGDGIRRAHGIAALDDGGVVVTGFFDGATDFGARTRTSSAQSAGVQAFALRLGP